MPTNKRVSFSSAHKIDKFELLSVGCVSAVTRIAFTLWSRYFRPFSWRTQRWSFSMENKIFFWITAKEKDYRCVILRNRRYLPLYIQQTNSVEFNNSDLIESFKIISRNGHLQLQVVWNLNPSADGFSRNNHRELTMICILLGSCFSYLQFRGEACYSGAQKPITFPPFWIFCPDHGPWLFALYA